MEKKLILSVTEIRDLIPEKAKNLSDEQLIQMCDFLETWARIVLDEIKTENEKNG
jgi:hypothetical protein